MSDDEEDEVCPRKDPEGGVYPWRSTDQVSSLYHERYLGRGISMEKYRSGIKFVL